ncbi:MAG: cytidine deaminase [Terracidiphilus sp.]|jgi:cytidine deaminase
MAKPSRREAVGIIAAGTMSLAATATAPAASLDVQSQGNKALSKLDAKQLEEMTKRAKRVCKSAYCPYSGFRVGAVALSDDGQMFEGCNIENASYGLTICAERNAIFQMVTQNKHRLTAIVIYTPTAKPTAPCGACRQVINEFGPDALVLSVCDGSDVIEKRLIELLPNAFGPANL